MDKTNALNSGQLPTSQRINAVSSLYRLAAVVSGVVFALGTIFSPMNDAWGQRDPQVVTMNNGLRYEGDQFYIPEITPATYALGGPLTAASIIGVNDGLKFTLLNQSKIINAKGNSTMANEIVFDIYQRKNSGSVGNGSFVFAGQFDEFGHREFRIAVNTPAGVVQRSFTQGITKITPRYCELKVLPKGPISMSWESKIGTGTVPKDVIYNLLIKQIKDRKNVNEYFDIVSFYQQNGDFTRAKEELQRLEQDFPDQKDRIRDARSDNRQYRARQILKEIEIRIAAGQNDLALDLAQATNKDGLAGQIVAQFQDIEEQLLKRPQTLQDARAKVTELIARLKKLSDDQVAAIRQFATELETELNDVTVLRLTAFSRLADDDELNDEAKISLAISGWVLGSNFAIENLAITQSMFQARALVREYLTLTTSKERRRQIITELEGLESGTPRYVDAMLKQMKPIAGKEDVENYSGEKPIEFFIEIPGTKADPTPKKFRCLAHLPGRGTPIKGLAEGEIAPPQYNPFRKYPLLITLPGGGQSLEANLDTWCGNYSYRLQNRMGQAMRNGYIVLAVDWRSQGQSSWNYSGLEHKVVLDALYEALTRFSIDSDRVFLSGHGRGADGAYDIGISHPEHWAGVLGYSGKFGKYIDKYLANTHVNLPMYCVNGQKDSTAISTMMTALNKWMRSKKYNDVTAVQYQGRANEFFIEDIPEAFKWMRPHRRKRPDKTGFEFECATFRPWDTYFWFFELRGIPESNVVRPALFDGVKKFPSKIRISGSYKENSNLFRLGPPNNIKLNDATLWLSPEYANLNETVEIAGRGKYKGPVVASVKVLLDDVRQRGEREHPYWARIDCINGTWTPNE
ncbi:MAG: hypothetical protein AB8B55_12980 [Mariniblastus sp.]